MLLTILINNVWLAGSIASILSLAIGFVAGWITANLFFKKQVDKNPPITEKQIRELYRQAGKQLSEKQVMQIMNNLKNSS